MLTNTTVDAATRQFIGTIHTVLTNTIVPLAPPQQVRVQKYSTLWAQSNDIHIGIRTLKL